jgi:hypothetical protein
MARLPRVIAVDSPHHVTQRGNARRFILDNDADRNIYLDSLKQSLALHDVAMTSRTQCGPPPEPTVVSGVFFGVSYSQERGARMAQNAVYIERREQGDYAVRKPGSERASAILPTQAKAIERAREMDPDAAVHVERVRDTNVGGRDKWRKL